MEARNQQCLVNFIDSPNSVLHIGCVQKISSCIYTKLKCQPPAQLVCMVDIYCTDICSFIFIKIQFEVLSIDSNVYKVTPYLQHGSWITWFFLSFEFQTIPKFTKNGCLLLNIQRKTPSTVFLPLIVIPWRLCMESANKKYFSIQVLDRVNKHVLMHQLKHGVIAFPHKLIILYWECIQLPGTECVYLM